MVRKILKGCHKYSSLLQEIEKPKALDYFKELTQRTQSGKGYLEENNIISILSDLNLVA